MATPKRITPNSRTLRDLYFNQKDIDAIIRHLRGRFYGTFTRGFNMCFQHGGESLAFSPQRPLTAVSVRRNLKGLGVSSRLIEMAVDAVEHLGKGGIPKPDHVRFDLWFKSLEGETFRDELKEVLAAKPEDLAAWNHRLKICGRTWEDISLSDETIINVTAGLFHVVLKDPTVTTEALKVRLRRWRRGKSRVRSHGFGGHIATPKALNDP